MFMLTMVRPSILLNPTHVSCCYDSDVALNVSDLLNVRSPDYKNTSFDEPGSQCEHLLSWVPYLYCLSTIVLPVLFCFYQ